MSRFTFHAANDLSGDLKRLMETPGSHTIPAEGSSTEKGFPGLVLLYDHRPCAAVGYTRESHSTAIMSKPFVFLEASEDICTTLREQLIKQAKTQLSSEGLRFLQFLIDASAEGAEFGQELTKHGFAHAADVLQWERTIAPGQPHEMATQARPGEANELGTVPVLNRSRDYQYATAEAIPEKNLQDALEAILSCSDDLSGLPRPTADQLLAKWSQVGASVVVASCDQEVAGIIAYAVVSEKPDRLPRPDETVVCIEYIGVAPAFRRRHVASELIDRIPKLPGLDSTRRSTRSLRIRAFSDQENFSATRLYQSQGFSQTNQMELWHCDLNSNF